MGEGDERMADLAKKAWVLQSYLDDRTGDLINTLSRSICDDLIREFLENR